MTLPNGYRFLPLTAEHKRAVLELDTWAFPFGQDTEALMELELELPWDRTVGVVAEEQPADEPGEPGEVELAALRSSFEFDAFPVPGAEVPAAGLTWVGVQPSHRRKGILRAMITDHFEHCRERGETISALFAAEAGIYGRFGYGLAARQWWGTIPRKAQLHPVAGSEEHTVRLERFDRDKHADAVAALHREVSRRPAGVDGPGDSLLNRPGSVVPTRPGHLRAHLYDPPALREGKEAIRLATVLREGEIRGYATMRRQGSWGAAGPDGSVLLGDLAALDAAATHALWSAILDLDLMANVKPRPRPLDDPILRLLVNPRLADSGINDNLWVRLIDAPGALSQRRYAADVDVVIELSDSMLPQNAGTWRLQAGAFAPAHVEATDAEPDLRLDTRELAAVYLGGTTLTELAVAGSVSELSPGAIARASAAFAWPIAPGTTWPF